MSKYSVQTFMDSLPTSILEDEHLRQLAEVAARVMLKVYETRWKPALYSRIDDMDEAVLDILASDLKVDWYDYDASVDVKKRQIKDSWYVHKHMGTKKAVETAVSDVWPISVVEEWFEYEGDPYHFRVALGADESSEDNPIDVDTVLKKVKLFKPARAVMDDGEPIIRVHCGITITTSRYMQTYHVLASGMRPTRAVHGNKNDSGIVCDSGGLTSTYRVRPCGTPLHALM